MKALLRQLVADQITASKAIDRRFFGALTTDGNGEFCKLVRELITPDAAVADIGGGKTPVFTVEEVADNRLRVTTGVLVREVRYFYVSSYFMFFVPLYLFWRVFNYPLIRMLPKRYCETFIFVGTRSR